MSLAHSEIILERWVAALSRRDWDTLKTLLSPDCSISANGCLLSKNEYLGHIQGDLKDDTGRSIWKLDYTVLDGVDDGHVAGRLVSDMAGLPSESNPTQRCELVFCWISDGVIVKWISLAGQGRHEPEDRDASLITKPEDGGKRRKRHAEMDRFYREYIDVINSLTMEQYLVRYCQPNVTHNNRRFTVNEYRLMIESSFQAIQGLRFTIEELFIDVDAQRIAALLGFTGLPVGDFDGVEPTGKEVRFSEPSIVSEMERLSVSAPCWTWTRTKGVSVIRGRWIGPITWPAGSPV
ncbi:hypothetical protein HIM_00797 [Hirsutella minnesotensis 3608]|nr:hypothetical protein HIM_00797 [Hirsutella minnesotensis 3608]